MVFACPNHALLISLFQVQVHELFHHRLSFCSDAFVKEELILYLGYGGTFDGCGVGDDGVQIKLFMVYLVLYAQLLIFLQNFFKFAYAVMYSLHILASSFGRFCTRACKIKVCSQRMPRHGDSRLCGHTSCKGHSRLLARHHTSRSSLGRWYGRRLRLYPRMSCRLR